MYQIITPEINPIEFDQFRNQSGENGQYNKNVDHRKMSDIHNNNNSHLFSFYFYNVGNKKATII